MTDKQMTAGERMAEIVKDIERTEERLEKAKDDRKEDVDAFCQREGHTERIEALKDQLFSLNAALRKLAHEPNQVLMEGV